MALASEPAYKGVRLRPFQGVDGDWYWKNVARSGRIVVVAGEGDRNKQDAYDQALAQI